MGRLNRRHFLTTAGLAATAAACGRTAVASAPDGPVTINIATNDPNYPTYFTTWAQRLSKDPGTYRYSVKSFIEATDQVVTKLIASYMSQDALPELPGLEISQFSRLQRDNIASHFLSDLGKAIPNLQRDFYHSRLTPYTSGGTVYGLDSDMCMSTYFYREDLFKKYHLSTDFDTWPDLISIGKTAKQKHDVSVVAVGSSDVTWTAMLTLQQGGQFFDTDGSLVMDNRETVTALETIRDGVTSGAFASFTDFYGAAAASALNQGQIIGFFMPD